MDHLRDRASGVRQFLPMTLLRVPERSPEPSLDYTDRVRFCLERESPEPETHLVNLVTRPQTSRCP